MVQEQPGQERRPGPWSEAAPTQPVESGAGAGAGVGAGAGAGGADPWQQPSAEPAPPPRAQQPAPAPEPEPAHHQSPPPQQAPQQSHQPAGQHQPWSSGSTFALPPTPVLVRVAQLAAPVLLVVALVLPLDASMPLRSHTLWALWALAGAVLQALPAIGVGGAVERRWTLAAVGAGALALYWLLVTLPSVATSGGFLVTLATACAVAGVLLSPGRRL